MNTCVGIIGGADGQTTIVSTPYWINWIGLVFMVLILIPNILYVIKSPMQQNLCKSRILNTLEQVGRYGCMLLMAAGTAFWKQGFPSVAAILIYLAGSSLLIVVYWICWALFFRKKRKGLALMLALLPACVFLISGITMRDPLLSLLAVLFGIGHTAVTMHNF